ncbi:MAG: hypothetical protein ACIAQ0_13605 [Phycisphaerales bacterium JB058]
MVCRTILSAVGLAACGASLAQNGPDLQTLGYSGEVVRPYSATAIVGMTVDGEYVYGDTIVYSQSSANRSDNAIIAYDSAQLADTYNNGNDYEPVCADVAPHFLNQPGSRYHFGSSVDIQSYAEDIVVAPESVGLPLSEVAFAGIVTACPNSGLFGPEPLFVIFESWEGFDNVAQFDGLDGFDHETAGGSVFAFPASRADDDGDTLIDGFLGGVVLDFNTIDTNGDFISDVYEQADGGYCVFVADRLNLFDIPLTSNLDLFNGGLPGTDGRGDGGVRLIWTRGLGDDGNGPLAGGYYPSSKAESMLWSTNSMQGGQGACGYAEQAGFGAGDSTPTLWAESENICSGVPGGLVVDDRYDTTFDLNYFDDMFGSYFNAIGPMIRLKVEELGASTDCCDANSDGVCSPADFSAWVAAYNRDAPHCDANQDAMCTPHDFSTWVAAFNASTGGDPMSCYF